jgi:hypothetical protein
VNCDAARLDLAFALRDELNEVDATELERHLASCRSCSAERVELAGTMALTAGRATGPPPEHLRAGVLSAVEAERVESALELVVEPPPEDLKARVLAAAAREDPGRRGGGRPVVFSSNRTTRLGRILAAAALVVGGLVLGAVAFRQNPPEIFAGDIPPGHATQTLRLTGDGPSSAEVRHYRHDNFRVTMSVEGFAPTPPGSHYVVWVRGAGGDVAVGTFRLKRPDDFDVPFAVGVNPSEFPELVVTLEPNGGSSALEGEVVVRGRFDPDRVHHGSYDD